MIIKLSQKDDNYNYEAFRLLAYALFFGAGTYGIKGIVVGIGLESLQTAASFLIYLGWFLLLGYTLLKNLRVLNRIIVWELVYAAIMAFSYFAFPDTRPYFSDNAMFIRQILTVYIPSGVIAMCITDYKNCFAPMRKLLWGGFFLLLCSLMTGFMQIWDYQQWGINLSPFVLISFACYMQSKHKMDLILFLLSAFLVLQGGRQSLFVVLLGIILIYFFMNQDKKEKQIMIILLIVLSIIVLFLMWNILLELLADVLAAFDIHSRTLEMLINGELISFDSRESIIEYSIDGIRKNGNKISGLFADRYYLKNLKMYSDWIEYPHNIFLEFFLDFGYIGGAIISLWLVIGLIKNMLVGQKERKTVMSVLIALVMVRLFVSSSFMIEGLFYTMLGMMGSWHKLDSEKNAGCEITKRQVIKNGR